MFKFASTSNFLRIIIYCLVQKLTRKLPIKAFLLKFLINVNE